MILIATISISVIGCTANQSKRDKNKLISANKVINILDIEEMVRSLQNEDGGYTEVPNDSRELYFTYYLLEALSYVKQEINDTLLLCS